MPCECPHWRRCGRSRLLCARIERQSQKKTTQYKIAATNHEIISLVLLIQPVRYAVRTRANSGPGHGSLIERCDPIRSVQTRLRNFDFTRPVPTVSLIGA